MLRKIHVLAAACVSHQQPASLGVFRPSKVLQCESRRREGTADDRDGKSGTPNPEAVGHVQRPSPVLLAFFLGSLCSLMPILAQYGVSQARCKEIADVLNNGFGYEEAAPLALLACSAAYHRVVLDEEQKLPDLLEAVKDINLNSVYIDGCVKPFLHYFNVVDFVPVNPANVPSKKKEDSQ